MSRTVDPFNNDVKDNEGYLYTTNSRLSSQLANRRLTDAALKAVDFTNKRVIDIGCGDGTYTFDLYERGNPAYIHGVDLAAEAIALAREKVADKPIKFDIQSADSIDFEDNSFDIAHLRGILHHIDRPFQAIKEALRVAPTLIIIEPNGYNPGLKLLERFSRYHVEHNEKSYAPFLLNKWVRDSGGMVASKKWAGFVPFFCPDGLARMLKAAEPAIENIPLVKLLGCAVYTLVVNREVTA